MTVAAGDDPNNDKPNQGAVNPSEHKGMAEKTPATEDNPASQE